MKKKPGKTKGPAKRAPLRSMKVSSGFREFVLDQLAAIDGLRAQAMFGGVGLYAGDAFFGLIATDTLFLKVDDTNRADFEAAGSEPFRPYEDRPTTMSYYDVPLAVLEDSSALRAWAMRSVDVANAAHGSPTGSCRHRARRGTDCRSDGRYRR